MSCVLEKRKNNLDNCISHSQIDAQTGTQVSRSELLQKSELLAHQLLSRGFKRGDVIAIFAPNSIEWVTVIAAAFRIDLLPACINAMLTAGLLQ